MSKQNVVATLCRVIRWNILQPKLDLFKSIEKKHGKAQVNAIYSKICPIVHASIGQHIRHSNDHIERVTEEVQVNLFEGHDPLNFMPRVTIPYDIRMRNTDDETDVAAATERIKQLQKDLESLQLQASHIDPIQPIDASFMLSAPKTKPDDESTLYSLIPSTIARELSFVQHHAIHHLAMIRIIATCSHVGGLDSSELPDNFGKAPSTIYNELIQQQKVE